MEVCNAQEKIQKSLKDCSHRLSIIICLTNLLIKLRFNLSPEHTKLINDTISCEIKNDEEEIGWEEVTNQNIIYLLKIALKKEMKDAPINITKIDELK